jgi:two-component system OmpR family sensor kinase
VVAVCAVVTALSLTPSLRGLGPPGAAALVLTVATATVTAGAAILAEITGRVCDDPRWSWAAAAFALYGVVVLPVSALAAQGDTPRLLLIRVAAYIVALPLLVISLRPPHRPSSAVPWGLTVVGALLATAASAVPEAAVPTRAVTAVLVLVVLPAWTAVAVGYVVDGYRRRHRARLRFGLGLAVVALAQLYRVATGAPAGDPVFVSLRLLGAVVVLVALAQLVARSLAAVRSQQFAQQEELMVAALHLERAQDLGAERDHELRNGLAGLAGITHLLSSGADDVEQQRLKQAVLSELSRLHTILDGGGLTFDAPDGPPRTEYAVEPVLAGLVTLRRSAGARVTLDADQGLRACGDAAVLAQVVTNLLANCERHAPDAAVTVRSYRSGDRAVVEVRDEGPGLRAALAHEVLQRGVHDPQAGGSGLGLHISAQLLAREGGELNLRTVTDPRGCLATVRLPVAGPSPDRPEVGRPGVAPTR